jgi:hypothetical protein
VEAIPEFETELPHPDSDEVRALLRNREVREAYRFLYNRRDEPLPTMSDWADYAAAVAGKATVHAQRRLRELREYFVVEAHNRGGTWVYRLVGRRAAVPDNRSPVVNSAVQAAVYAVKGRICQMCGRGPRDGVKLSIAYRVPPSWGGDESIDNLEPLCTEHANGNATFYASLDPFSVQIRRAIDHATAWERIGELLRAMRDAGQHVPAELLAVVAQDTNRGDPARRLRDLRVVLGWDIRAHKRKVGRITMVDYELVADQPWPPEGAKEAVNAYERLRKRRKADGS